MLVRDGASPPFLGGMKGHYRLLKGGSHFTRPLDVPSTARYRGNDPHALNFDLLSFALYPNISDGEVEFISTDKITNPSASREGSL